jgi:protein farnesyltransferase/geranylgeranyltransferase type-1 subunit alpha
MRHPSVCVHLVDVLKSHSLVPVCSTKITYFRLAQQMIQQDPRNNSAWNQRWFAAHRAVRDKPLSIELCRSEANFALEVGAKLDPYNESPFRYLIGLLREQQQQQPHAKNSMLATLSIEYYAAVEALRSVLEDAQRDPDACVNWTSARIDLLEGIHDEESLTKAIALATGMADQYDPIRKKYWELRVQQLEEKKSSIGSSSMTIN